MVFFFFQFNMDRSDSILQYLKRNNLKKMEKTMQAVAELVLMLMSVNEMGEIRVSLMPMTKLEMMDLMVVNFLKNKSLM